MTPSRSAEPPWDSGLQNERTRLAWQRTTLSGLTCSLLVARLLAERSLVLAVAVGLAAVLNSVILGWFASRRYADNQRTLRARGRLGGALSHLVLTGLVTVASLGGMWYLAVQ